jgi:hypothetical protein
VLFSTPFSRPLFWPLCAPGVSRPVFCRPPATLFSRLCARRGAPLFSPLCERVFSPPLCGRLFSQRLCERFFSRPLFSPLCARVFSRRGWRLLFWRLRNVWQPVCERQLFSLFSQWGTSAEASMLLVVDRRTGRARPYRSRNSMSAFCAWRRFSA